MGRLEKGEQERKGGGVDGEITPKNSTCRVYIVNCRKNNHSKPLRESLHMQAHRLKRYGRLLKVK